MKELMWRYIPIKSNLHIFSFLTLDFLRIDHSLQVLKRTSKPQFLFLCDHLSWNKFFHSKRRSQWLSNCQKGTAPLGIERVNYLLLSLLWTFIKFDSGAKNLQLDLILSIKKINTFCYILIKLGHHDIIIGYSYWPSLRVMGQNCRFFINGYF